MPSSPTSASAGTSTPSKKTSVVAWFIIVLIGRIVIVPSATACCMSTRNVESPSVRFSTWSSGVVRASSSIRSECSARDVQIFWPRIDVAAVDALGASSGSRVVSEPAVGSVTPNAWSRSSPEAICGR